jgi:hypothetical protein
MNSIAQKKRIAMESRLVHVGDVDPELLLSYEVASVSKLPLGTGIRKYKIVKSRNGRTVSLVFDKTFKNNTPKSAIRRFGRRNLYDSSAVERLYSFDNIDTEQAVATANRSASQKELAFYSKFKSKK